MKPLFNTMLLPAFGVISLFLASVQTAQAASTFSSSATLTYTLDSVVNLDHPGTFPGFSVQGSFQQAGSPNSYANTTGDGAVVASNASVIIPLSAGSSFVQSFAVSGGVTGGTVGSSHLGQFAVGFNNTGADQYAIQVTLGYELNASAGGEYADSDVFLDYSNAGGSFSGSDYVNASVFGLSGDTKSGSSGAFSFNLAANASQSLYGDVVINGNLQAVPLPAAVWLFASGILAAFGVARRGRA